uniref:Uncharacterized protein n=1 Tax=Cacopsylla melanoneura TaxID=428564 RepID=A0A8D9B910_9HEMI
MMQHRFHMTWLCLSFRTVQRHVVAGLIDVVLVLLRSLGRVLMVERYGGFIQRGYVGWGITMLDVDGNVPGLWRQDMSDGHRARASGIYKRRTDENKSQSHQ